MWLPAVSKSHVTRTRTDRPSAAVLLVGAVAVVITYCDHFSTYGGIATAEELVYPGQAKSERDLSTCERYEICSVVHKRYWFPNRVERFCRCDHSECPTSWTEWADEAGTGDEFTMMVNNRAQMKFCEPVRALPNCLETGPSSVSGSGSAANNTRPLSPASAWQRFLNVVNETRTEIINNATVQNYKLTSNAQCYCPPHNTWIAHAFQKNESGGPGVAAAAVSYTWTSYRCSELPKCKANDMCGFERTDFYSNFYKCSCPSGNICTRQSPPATQTVQVNELLYEGPAFVTNCQSKP